ncbi:3-deoxy-D-manno-octulosonic acid transferase [Vannielia litorea]|uniref:3-deoxy-D-manno-octulosonic acid transferase n=1 Tax=Vannielia litorea TaxID=1217970 RepID=UPI001BCF877F|nr:glycosyltransferase N-terminal domain-containing protein [Vannielia litorea]MBS8229151.1 3-deoxy-D-manno-octulosonic acid transferase [Vannielia litorea]
MRLYRLLFSLLALPALTLLFALRLLRRAERPEDIRERLATTDAPPLPGPRLWLHGASNGELAAARTLAEALLTAHPQLHLTITANTTTGRALAAGWGLPRLTACLAPIDSRAAHRRFLAQHGPQALVIVENELWPNRITLSREAGLAVIVISARLSARSARRWGKWPALAREVLSSITLLSAQDAESAERFAALGLPEQARATPVALKNTAPPPSVDPAALQDLAPQFTRENTLLAASTHPGEEEQLLSAFTEARKSRPDLRLILAPRHARRGAEVAALIERAGLAFATRSKGEAPGEAPVFLADTMGEMGLWYALSGLCFTGGSLVEKGGHTPWEPVHFGCALLHGPSCFNQAEAFNALHAAGAALEVRDAAGLARALATLTPAEQARMAKSAQAVARARRADIAPLLAAICEAANLAAAAKA